MIKSVSQMLYKPTETLVIKLSVGLLDGTDKEMFYSLYATERYDYLTFNTSANIIIQYKTKAPYDRNQMIHINIGNIYQWRKFLKDVYVEVMSVKGLFNREGKNGPLIINEKLSVKKSVTLKGNEYVEFEPTVVVDKGNVMLPGVAMRINIKDNRVDLTYDEFESMMTIFGGIDISSAAMQLILARLIVDSKMKIETSDRLPELSERVVNPNDRPSLYGTLSEERETVVDNRPKSIFDNKPTSLDDIM